MKISKAENYTGSDIAQNYSTYNKTVDRYNQKTVNNTVAFTGGIDTAFNALNYVFQGLDKHPMIQVSFVDTVSTNIPRTVVDFKTSLAAALETCRREFSGLFVNCLMPGLIVKYVVANLLPKAQELKGTDVVSSWANNSSIDRFKDVYKNAHKSGAENTTKEYVKNSLMSLRGLDGNNWVEYSSLSQKPEFHSAVEDITNAISKKGNDRADLLKNAKTKLAEITKAENILQFNGQKQANLEETIRDITDLGAKFEKVKEMTAKELGKDIKLLSSEELSSAIDKYGNTLKRFVTNKSSIGLGIVIAIAVSIQTINRAITRKQFDAEGAPIYKDFGKKNTAPKMNEKEKKEFLGQRLLASAGMFTLALLSMMKKPTKEMFQFSGIFPTLDQCRWIASFTFASRMMASEDKNELRETTIRDVASFAGLYFLGDYVKKGCASIIEAVSKTEKGKKLFGEEIVLLNRMPNTKKQEEKTFLNKLNNWIKNTELKTANEVKSIKVRNLRNLCRVADISFSIAMLGVLLPLYNRKVTERKVAEAKQKEEMQKQVIMGLPLNDKKNTPSVFKNIV